jgi:hypothetical protein
MLLGYRGARCQVCLIRHQEKTREELKVPSRYSVIFQQYVIQLCKAALIDYCCLNSFFKLGLWGVLHVPEKAKSPSEDRLFIFNTSINCSLQKHHQTEASESSVSDPPKAVSPTLVSENIVSVSAYSTPSNVID